MSHTLLCSRFVLEKIFATDEIDSSVGFDLAVELQCDDETGERIPARLRRVNTGFLRVRSPVWIRPGRRLRMLYEGHATEVEVVYCVRPELGPCHLGLKILSHTGGAIRHEVQLPVDIRASMNFPGAVAPIRGRVVDISPSGLGLLLSKPVTAGEYASVDLGHGIAFGEIRYCRAESKRTFRACFWIEEFMPRNRKEVPLRRKPEARSVAWATIAAFANKLMGTTIHSVVHVVQVLSAFISRHA